MDALANSMLGVYVSVPFCRAKCSFCNFASGVGTAAFIEAYVEQLCIEIASCGARASALQAELPRSVNTVYFGGGTPSLLEPPQLGRIVAALRATFDIASDAEITLEAAPGQISDSLLDKGQRSGVNRVSLGVQSFIDRESASVGRLHNERECIAEIERLRAAGIAEVGADLIAGLPYQTAESWNHSLNVAAALSLAGSLTHLSVYMLEIDEDSRLGQEVLAGGQRFHAHGVPQEEISAQLYERACERLPQAGFAQYEISNFAIAGHRSRHNIKYWQREPYIGFGLDAHSMLRTAKGAVRFANAEGLEDYMRKDETESPLRMLSPKDSVVSVGVAEAFEETIFLGLRMAEGLDPAVLRADYPKELAAACEPVVHELVADGLMSNESNRWRLTLRGRLISNEVFGRLLEGVVA